MFRIIAIASFIYFISAAPATACPGCYYTQFPVNPGWILLATGLLMILNYHLLYQKIFFIIDIACVILIGLAFSHYPTFPAGPFLVSIVFATLRLLTRHDVPWLTRGVIPAYKTRFVTAAFWVVILLWCAVIFCPPLLVYSRYSVINALKNMGTALESYADAHQKSYPAELNEIVPNHIREIPSPYISPKDVKNLAIYRKRLNIKNDFSYTRSSDTSAYTIECLIPIRSVRNGTGHFLYSSSEGIIE
ncbi:MAG: hypothetical protein AB9903_01110 [Vulcanimicrobiota bacterium]